MVQLHLDNDETLPPRTSVKAQHRFLTGTAVAAVLEVIDSRPGMANARPIYRDRRPKISRGDEIVAWK